MLLTSFVMPTNNVLDIEKAENHGWGEEGKVCWNDECYPEEVSDFLLEKEHGGKDSLRGNDDSEPYFEDDIDDGNTLYVLISESKNSHPVLAESLSMTVNGSHQFGLLNAYSFSSVADVNMTWIVLLLTKIVVGNSPCKG